jgi:hypothetical protein
MRDKGKNYSFNHPGPNRLGPLGEELSEDMEFRI